MYISHFTWQIMPFVSVQHNISDSYSLKKFYLVFVQLPFYNTEFVKLKTTLLCKKLLLSICPIALLQHWVC